jgi:hypothetical protein
MIQEPVLSRLRLSEAAGNPGPLAWADMSLSLRDAGYLGMRNDRIGFILHGRRLHGTYSLIRFGRKGPRAFPGRWPGLSCGCPFGTRDVQKSEVRGRRSEVGGGDRQQVGFGLHGRRLDGTYSLIRFERRGPRDWRLVRRRGETKG